MMWGLKRAEGIRIDDCSFSMWRRETDYYFACLSNGGLGLIWWGLTWEIGRSIRKSGEDVDRGMIFWCSVAGEKTRVWFEGPHHELQMGGSIYPVRRKFWTSHLVSLSSFITSLLNHLSSTSHSAIHRLFLFSCFILTLDRFSLSIRLSSKLNNGFNSPSYTTWIPPHYRKVSLSTPLPSPVPIPNLDPLEENSNRVRKISKWFNKPGNERLPFWYRSLGSFSNRWLWSWGSSVCFEVVSRGKIFFEVRPGWGSGFSNCRWVSWSRVFVEWQ